MSAGGRFRGTASTTISRRGGLASGAHNGPMAPRSGSGRVFVSYSRRQFHAARQLTAVLHEHGIDAWFDVQRLVPGTDWAATIDEAIDEAAALVLVASPDAVASGYVTREWQRARDRGIPVHVAEVRGTRLPAELAAAPRFDLRRRFEDGAARLATALTDGPTPPSPQRRFVLWPASVLLVVAALGLSALAVAGLFAAVMADLDHPIPERHRPAAVVTGAVCLVYAGWLIQPLITFGRGRARMISLLLPLYATPVLLFYAWSVLASLVAVVNNGGTSIARASLSGDFTEPYVLICLPVLAANAAALVALRRSAAVLRRLPPGEGPRRLSDVGRQAPTDPVRSVAIDHDPADADVAEQIAAAFRSAGARLTDADADLRLVVISNVTTWERAAAALRSGRTIAVLVCGLRLPGEADELRRVQWVDHRDGHTDRLRALAGLLVRPGETALAAPAVPRAPDVFDAPRPAKILLECLVAAAAVFALSAAFTATVAPSSENRVHSQEPRLLPNPGPRTSYTPVRPRLSCDPAPRRSFPPPVPAPSAAATLPPIPADPGLLLRGRCRFVVPTPPSRSPEPRMIKNPDYPELPPSADPLLRWRAGMAVALAVLALFLAYGLARRAVRRAVLETGMLALFFLAAAWALLGAVELNPLRLVLYAAVWVAAAIGLLRHSGTILAWLPGEGRRPRRHLTVAPAGLLRPTLPIALFLLGIWYSGGIIL